MAAVAVRGSWAVKVVLLGLLAGTAARAEGAWQPIGPDGGAPQVLAAAPGDSQRLYAALPWANYYGLDTRVVRSRDGGASWQMANRGLARERVIALAVDPEDADHLFAVTGVQGCYSDGPGGVFRTGDAGAHWTLVASARDLGGLACRSTVLFASDAVLVATGRAIWRSTDRGESWQAAAVPAASGCELLVASQAEPLELYCAGGFSRLRSRDGGLTWTALADPPARYGAAVTAFAPSPEARTLYEYSPYPGTLYRSVDDGATWETLSAPDSFTLETDHLLADPRSAGTLYLAASHGLFSSRNRGESWTLLRRGLPELSLFRTTYSGVHALLADAAGAVLAATGKGVYRSEDSGASWRAAAGRGLHQNPVTMLRFDSYDPERFLLRSFDDLFATGDGGRTFARLATPFPRPPQVVEFDPFTPGRLLALIAGTEGGVGRVYESRDGGGSWAEIGWTPRAFSSVGFGTADLVLATGFESLYRSSDGGRSWRRALQVQPADERGWFIFESVTHDPRRPTHFYAIGRDHFLHGGALPVIYRSADSGLTWQRWAEGYAALAFPRDPRAVLAVRYDRLYSTRDEGRSFREVGGIPQPPPDAIVAVVVDRERRGVLWAGTVLSGVLRSTDGGRTWTRVREGLPQAPEIGVTTLAQDLGWPPHLFAALTTGGLWRLGDPGPGAEPAIALGGEPRQLLLGLERLGAQVLIAVLDRARLTEQRFQPLDLLNGHADQGNRGPDQAHRKSNLGGSKLVEADPRSDEPGSQSNEPGLQLDEAGSRSAEPGSQLDEPGPRLGWAGSPIK